MFYLEFMSLLPKMAPQGIVSFADWAKGHPSYDRFVLQRIAEIAASPNVIGFSFYSQVPLHGKMWEVETITVPEVALANRTTGEYLKKAYGPFTGLVIADAFLIPEYYSISLHCVPIDHLRLFLAG
jgi:hypothetical protein